MTELVPQNRTPDERARVVPVSMAQRRLWFVDGVVGGSRDYCVVWPLRLRGPLDVDRLAAAVAAVVARHEVLRSRFVGVDGEPVMVVEPPGDVPVEFVDLSGVSESVREVELGRLVGEEGDRVFDLAAGPVARFRLVRLGVAEHVLIVAAHHIVFDGWSGSVFLRDLGVLYSGGVLPDLVVSFSDFVVWEREWLSGGVLEEQVGFWRRALAGAPSVVELPVDRVRPVRRSGAGARLAFGLDAGVVAGLSGVCRVEGATLFMGLLGVLNVVVSRYCGVSDVVVGTFASNRTMPELEELVGFFVNTLVLRTDVAGDPGFGEVVRRSRVTAVGAFGHQDVPFDRVVEEVAPARVAGVMPFVQVALVVQNAPEAGGGLGSGVVVEPVPVEVRSAAFDLSVQVWEAAGGGVEGFVEYSTELFDRVTIERFVTAFGLVVEAGVADPERPISELPLVPPDPSALGSIAEASSLRTPAPGSSAPHTPITSAPTTSTPTTSTPTTSTPARAITGTPVTSAAVMSAPAPEAPVAGVRCLHELIAQQAELRPQAVAATCAGAEMTYGELDRRARELAARLRALGAGPESMVGVCLNRSLDVPVALLAVLYAGAAYLPLEPDYPEERLAYMIEDSGAQVVVTDDECAPRLPAGLRLVRAGEGAGAGSAAGTGGADLAGRGDPDSLAYVIYTSGSTGRPKGVAVSHRAVARRVKDPAWLPLREHEVFLFTTPLSFDVSVLEVFGCLTNGHTLAILPAGKALPERVAAFLAAEPVTVTWLTAALFHAVVDCAERPFPTVRWLIAGGDQLSADHVERARALVPNGRVMNGYGPTECTIFTTTHPVPDDHAGRVPIGEALPYTRAHIVDRNLYPVPDGVAGELLVGGEGLARGYLHRPGLTAERFVPNPLARTPGERLYRTGDLVRRRSDGPIEFLGRSDHQVKIRGFRVELEEAEQVLRRHPAVRDVVVTAPAHEGDRRLVAYVVPEGRWPGSSELLRHAREALPDYMVPALFVTLDTLPVSPNGKVDRAALPEPEAVRPDLDGAYVPPRDPIEQTLAGLWTTLLGLDRIGVNDHFFDIGGHSLLASRLLARVRRAFGRDVPLADFLATPTIAGLAELVQSRLLAPGGPSRPPIARAVHGDSLPASLGQRRLWFVDGVVGGSRDYCVVWPLRLRGPLDVDRLVAAVAAVVARHEVLRSRFVGVGGEPVMVVEPPGDVPVEFVDLSGVSESVREVELGRLVGEEGDRVFDLAAGPVARFRLVRLGVAEHVLIVAAHHIVFDGWSGSVFLRDLGVLYSGGVLPDLVVSFSDFVVWEREWLSGGVLEEQVGFWRRALAGAPSVVELPVDRVRPVRRSGAGARLAFGLDAGVVAGLSGVCRVEGATLFMGLLGVLNVVVSRYCGVSDVVVGTFASNRTMPELEELVGFFVNTLVLRTDVAGDPGFGEVVRRSRVTAVGAFGHQDVPFDRVVEEVAPARVAGVMPFVQVALVVQNAPEAGGGLGSGVVVEPVPVEVRSAAFDLSVQVWEAAGGGVEGFVEYSTELFDRVTIERFVTAFGLVVEAGVADPERPISELPLVPPGEPYTLAGAAATDEDRIADLFARRAAATPDAVAFITRSRAHDVESDAPPSGSRDVDSDAPRADRTDAEATGELTYREVDRRARELATRLHALGAGPESVVGVCLPPGPDLPVALLGILYAGAAYLPLDPALPVERLAYMIEDAGAALVVIDPPGPWAPSGDSTNPSGPAYSAGLPAGTRPVPVRRPSAGITENAPPVHGDIGEAVTLPVAADPDGLAAVIYTSGSTGRPKGVAITGRSLLNRLAWMWRDLPFGPDEVCCQKTAIGFVDSLWELLGPPLAGVPTVVVEPATVRDPLAFVEELASGRVTRLLLVPSLLRVLLHAVPDLDARLPRLTTWISSGEPLSQELSRLFHERMPGRTLVNLYGASEAWDALCPEPDTAPTPVEHADSGDSQPGEGAHGVPVGRPIAGVRACVLDGGLLPVPAGVPGELYVGGRCLARGYLGRPALTAARFLPDPAGSGERLYRTGDLARVRSDGQIELLGRADHQVKIRGMRVEPGEVEAALDEFPEVGQAAVVAARAGDDVVLVAHVVPAEGAAPCVPAELKRALARRLPAHLVPAQVVLRDELPRTATGKIDRRSLADEGLVSGTLTEDPQRDRDGREPFGEAEPVTELERRIAAVWAEALGREVGRYDDFFDVGGHSLLAPVLVAKLSAELSVDLPLSWVFDHPTVYAMSRSPEPARTGDGGPTDPCHAPHDVGEPGRKGCIP